MIKNYRWIKVPSGPMLTISVNKILQAVFI